MTELLDFRRVAHTAHKSGQYSHIWEGAITFVTTQRILDEISIQRDLEAMVNSGHLVVIGNLPRLGSVTFNWRPVAEERERFGADIACIITVGYRSEVTPVQTAEAAERLEKTPVVIAE